MDVDQDIDKFCPFGKMLLSQWAWGDISAKNVQAYAHAAQLSGLHSPDVAFLARLGSYGHHPGNIQRDLLKKFTNEMCTPELSLAHPYLKRKRGGMHRLVKHPCPVLLPHDWLASLAQHGLLDQVLCRQKVDTFWGQQNKADPKLYQNPVLDVDDYSSIAVPMLLHGDAASFQNRDSLMIYSMRSLLVDSPVFESQLLLAAIPKSCTVNHGQMATWEHIWSLLSWSFIAAFKGLHPDADHNGKPFEEGSYRSKVAGKRLDPIHKTMLMIYTVSGDMEFFANDLKLNHFASTYPCFKCACDATDAPWNDFRTSAVWRQLVYTKDDNREQPATKHGIMNIPGVVSETFAMDIMHVVDMGLSMHFVGNVFFEACYDYTWPLERLWARVLELYGELGIAHSNRITKLSKENFTNSGKPHKVFPCLRGIKARETRYLVPVALALCQEFENTFGSIGSDVEWHYCRHRTLCCKALLQFYSAIDSGGMFLDGAQQTKVKQSIDHFLLHYSWLAKAASSQGQYKWSIVPKFHYAAHIPEQSLYINPRKTWAYGGEAMVGLIARLAASCMRGTANVSVPLSLMKKYKLGMHIALQTGR